MFAMPLSVLQLSEQRQYDHQSLFIRGGCLVILVVLFQYFIARVPTVQKETKRRFQHALTGHALVQISYVLPKSIALTLLLVGSIVMYVMHAFFFRQFLDAFGPLLRPNEFSGEVLPGAFYFLVGTAMTISPRFITDDIIITRYAVECLALADPMASWIGSSIPSPKFTTTRTILTKKKVPSSSTTSSRQQLQALGEEGEGTTASISVTRTTSLSGCLACFITAWTVGYWMLLSGNNAAADADDEGDNNNKYTYTTLFVGAAACTIAEALPYGNDNMNIPVITAFVVQQFGV